MNPLSDLSASERLILQHVARRAGEDTDSRDGWCRWSTSDRWPWEWHDYRPLVASGLLERRETWKDVLLRLTDEGWQRLASDEDHDA
jgi:hypothetical protein